MQYTFINYLPWIGEGVLLTINITVLSSLLSVIIGITVALGRLSKSKIMRSFCITYTSVIRGIPDLVLMMLIFFGGQILINNLVQIFQPGGFINIDAFSAGVITMGIIYGAYMAETFRGALHAIHPGQIEAADSFGLSAPQIFARITLPQMIRYAISGCNNNIAVLLKATALVSVIGLNDMVRIGNMAGQQLREPFFVMVCIAGLYLLFTFMISLGFGFLERKYAYF